MVLSRCPLCGNDSERRLCSCGTSHMSSPLIPRSIPDGRCCDICLGAIGQNLSYKKLLDPEILARLQSAT